MFFLESVKLALDTLRSHKLRSFLTLLGVIISVTTLIAVVEPSPGVANFDVRGAVADAAFCSLMQAAPPRRARAAG